MKFLIKPTKKQNLIAIALAGVLPLTSVCAAETNPAEARAIAKEAYIYGFPMVDTFTSAVFVMW